METDWAERRRKRDKGQEMEVDLGHAQEKKLSREGILRLKTARRATCWEA